MTDYVVSRVFALIKDYLVQKKDQYPQLDTLVMAHVRQEWWRQCRIKSPASAKKELESVPYFCVLTLFTFRYQSFRFLALLQRLLYEVILPITLSTTTTTASSEANNAAAEETTRHVLQILTSLQNRIIEGAFDNYDAIAERHRDAVVDGEAHLFGTLSYLVPLYLILMGHVGQIAPSGQLPPAVHDALTAWLVTRMFSLESVSGWFSVIGEGLYLLKQVGLESVDVLHHRLLGSSRAPTIEQSQTIAEAAPVVASATTAAPVNTNTAFPHQVIVTDVPAATAATLPQQTKMIVVSRVFAPPAALLHRARQHHQPPSITRNDARTAPKRKRVDNNHDVDEDASYLRTVNRTAATTIAPPTNDTSTTLPDPKRAKTQAVHAAQRHEADIVAQHAVCAIVTDDDIVITED